MPILEDYQIEGIRWLRRVQKGILADLVGMGKTTQVLHAVYGDPPLRGRKLILFSNYDLARTWKEEALKWLGIKGFITIAPSTSSEKRRAIYRDLGRNDTLLMSYSMMHKDAHYLASLGFQIVIADEAHRLKNRHRKRKTKTVSGTIETRLTRSGAFKMLTNRASYVFLVTATPSQNNADEMWSLLNIINPSKFRSYHEFVKEHFNTETTYIGNSGKFIRPTTVRDTAKLQAVISDHLLRREIDVVKRDLIEVPVKIDLSLEQRRMLRELTEDWFTKYGDSEMVSVVNVVSLITRRRQICLSPGLPTNTEPFSGPKLDWLLNLLEESPEEPVLVATCFRAWAEFVARTVGGVALTGGLGSSLSTRIQAFSRGEYKVAVAVVDVLEGQNDLQYAASKMVFADLPWNPYKVEQAIGRLHRRGQENTVSVFYLISAGTDEEIVQIHRNKKALVESMIPTRELREILRI